MKPSLTIAIPTFDNLSQLHDAIKSLLAYTDFPYKIVVVNNCPAMAADCDHLVSRIEGDLVSVMHMPDNLGWMGAINQVLAVTDTEYFCMLNDDVMFIPGQALFWRTLVKHLDDPNNGAVGPCSNFVAGVQSLFSMDSPMVMQTSLLIGMCMVLRTQDLKDLGGLDMTLVGGDDLDLSIRILKSEKRLVCDKSCYIHHIGQQTGMRVRPNTWDSVDTQEKSYNQIIYKHGVKAWHTTFSAAWGMMPQHTDYLSADSEDDWISEKLAVYRGTPLKGVNLGCGHDVSQVEDLNVWGLDLARVGETGVGGRKFSGAQPDITADALKIPTADASLDFIVARHLFEHLLDPLEALKEWGRALKHGGKLFLSAPDHSRIPSMILDCSHVHAYTPESLAQLLILAGWDVVECRTVGWGVVICHARACHR